MMQIEFLFLECSRLLLQGTLQLEFIRGQHVLVDVVLAEDCEWNDDVAGGLNRT
jgi:hypothetical protein